MDKPKEDRELIFHKLSVVNENIGHYRDKIESYLKYLILIYSGVFSAFLTRFSEIRSIIQNIPKIGLDDALKQSELNYYLLSFILLMCIYLSTYCMWVIMTSAVHLKKLLDTSKEIENLINYSQDFEKIEDKIYTKYLYQEKLGKIFNVLFNHKITFSELFLTSNISTAIVILINMVLIPFSAFLWLVSVLISKSIPQYGYYIAFAFFFLLYVIQIFFLSFRDYVHGITYEKKKKTRYWSLNYRLLILFILIIQSAIIFELLLNYVL